MFITLALTEDNFDIFVDFLKPNLPRDCDYICDWIVAISLFDFENIFLRYDNMMPQQST